MEYKYSWRILSTINIFIIFFLLIDQQWPHQHCAEATISGFIRFEIKPPETELKGKRRGRRRRKSARTVFHVMAIADRMETLVAGMPNLEEEFNEKWADKVENGEMTVADFYAKQELFVRQHRLLPNGVSKIQQLTGDDGKKYGIVFNGPAEVLHNFNEKKAALGHVNMKSVVDLLHGSANGAAEAAKHKGLQHYAQSYSMTNGYNIFEVRLGGDRPGDLYDVNAKPVIKEIMGSNHIDGWLTEEFKDSLDHYLGKKGDKTDQQQQDVPPVSTKKLGKRKKKRTGFVVGSDLDALAGVGRAMYRQSGLVTRPNAVSANADMVIFHGEEREPGESAAAQRRRIPQKVSCSGVDCHTEAERLSKMALKSDYQIVEGLMEKKEIGQERGEILLHLLRKRDRTGDWDKYAHAFSNGANPRNAKPPPVPSDPSSSRKEQGISKRQKGRRNRLNKRQNMRRNRANRRRKNAARKSGK